MCAVHTMGMCRRRIFSYIIFDGIRIIYVWHYIWYLHCAITTKFCVGTIKQRQRISILFRMYSDYLQIDELILGAFVNAIMAFYFEITQIIG